MNTLFVLLLACVITVGLTFWCNKSQDDVCKKILKGLVITYVIVVLVRKFLPDGFIFVNEMGDDGLPLSTTLPKDLSQSILRWGLEICFAVNVVALMTENKFFKNFSVCVCLPVAVVSAFFYNEFLTYLTMAGDSHWANVNIPAFVHHAQFYLEIALSVAMPLLLITVEHFRPFAAKRDVLHFVLGFLPVVIVCIPMFVPSSIWGHTSFVVGQNMQHTALWIFGFIVLGFATYLLFRNKSEDTRYSICLFAVTALVMFFAEKGVLGPKLSRISLFQLCNLANYLLFICVLFRKQFLFDYILYANTLGAIIAFCFPDVHSGILSPWDIHFFYDHAMLLVFPAVMLGLGIFKRPGLKGLKNCLICFAVYFGFCLVAGTIINGVIDNNLIEGTFFKNLNMWERANFFYLFDHNRILEAVSFLGFLFDVRWAIGPFELYPVWVAFFLVAFSGVICLVYLIFSLLMKLADKHIAWHKRNVTKGIYIAPCVAIISSILFVLLLIIYLAIYVKPMLAICTLPLVLFVLAFRSQIKSCFSRKK